MSLLQRFSILIDTNAKESAKDVDKLDKSTGKLNKGLNQTEKEYDILTKTQHKYAEQIMHTNQETQNLAKTIRKMSTQDLIKFRDEMKIHPDAIAKAQDYNQALKFMDGQVKKNISSFELLTSKLGILGSVFIAGFSFEGIKKSAEQMDDLGKQAQALGEKVGTLDAWQQAFIRYGGSAQDANKDLKVLTREASNFALLNRGVGKPVFEKYGIDVKNANGSIKTGSQLLIELAKHLKGMSKAGIQGVASSLMLSQSSVRMLQDGATAMQNQIDKQFELGVVTADQAKASANFNDQLADTGQIFTHVSRQLTADMLPALTKLFQMLDKIVVFIENHGAFVKGFFTTLGTVIALRYLPAVIEAALATSFLELPLLLLVGAFALVATIIGLVVDDIHKFNTGGKSLIGDFANWSEKKLHGLLDFIDEFRKTLINYFKDSWSSIQASFDEFYNWIVRKLHQLTDLIPDFVKTGFSDLFGSDTTIKHAVKHTLDNNQSAILSSNAMDQANVTKSTTFANAVNMTQAPSTTNVSIDAVNVQTQATDSDGIANTISDHINDHIVNAQANRTSGVKA